MVTTTSSTLGLIPVLDHWQTLVGSTLGPFLAVFLTAWIGWRASKKKTGKELKEGMRRIEIGTTRSLEDAYSTCEQLKTASESIKKLASEVETITDPNAFVLDRVNFPITGEIYTDPDTGFLKTKSYYLHNKILISNRVLKELNVALQSLKTEFEDLIRQNQFVVTAKETPFNQRKMYATNLKNFVATLHYYTDAGIPILIKLLMQIKFYNELLRQNHSRTLSKYEYLRFKYLRSAEKRKKYCNSIHSVDRIDQEIDPKVIELIQNAETRKAENMALAKAKRI